VVFSVLGCMFNLAVPIAARINKWIFPLLEIAGGLHVFLEDSALSVFEQVLLGAFLSFGGLSLLLQNYIVLKPLQIRFLELLLFAVLRALYAAAVMLALHVT